MRLAKAEDLPALKAIYSAIGADMRAEGNPQWNTDYPEMTMLLNDVDHQQLWIMEEDGQILGAFALIFGDDDTYRHIENGRWLNDEPYAAIHRFFVHPDARHKGLGRRLLAFCDDEVLRQGVYNLRIDTHANNPAMQALVLTCSYIPTGTITAKDGLARLAYQKVLSPASQAKALERIPMYTIDILEEEHRNISRLTRILRAISLEMFRGSEPPTADIRDIIRFIRDYADGEHHAKEENLLFKAMLEHIPGDLAKALVGHGMVAEHDLSRYTIMSLETCNNRYAITPGDALRLDIVVCLMDYANLLDKHTKTEMRIAYPFGIRELPSEILEKIDHDTRQILNTDASKKRRTQSLAILERLEEKWITQTEA